MSRQSLVDALPPGDLLLLDSTVVISHFKGTEGTSPVATYIVDRFVAGGRNPAIVSALTVMELLVAPIRERDDALYRQMLFFLQNTTNLRVAMVDFAVSQEAATLRAIYNFKAPDALIMGTGRAEQARRFVTNDGEWKRKLPDTMSPGIKVCCLEDHLPFP